MNLADELRKLQELHQNGSLTDAEFAAAKAKVLSQGEVASEPNTGQAVQQHLEEIRLQNSIAQLDRQWELDRDRYMVATRYGHRQLPSKGLSVLAGVAITVFGIFWIAMAVTIAGEFGGEFGGGPSFFPLFGVLFIVVGIGVSIYSFSKASQYEEAHARYRRRRAEMLGDNRETEAGLIDERIQE